ncbi:MAG: cysteine--tRNA ligase [Acholeplasmataceae bacterium]|nr:cysteine--tRNA ligase [Acholeplasmataceae bacterium]
MLKIYNSKTNKIEDFKPINPPEVLMYVCGPTVYDHIHIGNARPIIFFDMLKRYLHAIGYKVKYATNITDVDDRIINKAIEENKQESEITKHYIDETLKLFPKLNIKKPDIMPKATEYIDKMITYIDTLIEKGFAYELNGDVYFRVSKVKEYGEISNQDIDKLVEGARIDVNLKKEDPKDFNLWKATDLGVKYESKWSKGRPGWHTECAVMNHEIFGRELDIHGGGIDLKFPHHENENAQSIAHNDHGLAKYWIHSAFINLTNTKMSKSLGNVISVKNLESDYNLLAYRLLIVSHHYQQPINYSDELMEQYSSEYKRIERTLKNAFLKFELENYKLSEDKLDNKSLINFYNEMNNNLNTPNAMTVVYELIKSINRESNLENLEKYYNSLVMILKILGFEFNFPSISSLDRKLYKDWQLARENKDYNKADELRSILQKKGLI